MTGTGASTPFSALAGSWRSAATSAAVNGELRSPTSPSSAICVARLLAIAWNDVSSRACESPRSWWIAGWNPTLNTSPL